jgi:hypothetical protein
MGPEWPLSTKVDTKFRRQVAVDQSVSFARGLRATEFFFMGPEWNQVHYYCDHVLDSSTSPGWSMVMIVEQFMELMSGGRNRSTRRKPASMLLCPPQITRELTRARNWAAAVGSRRLAAKFWFLGRLIFNLDDGGDTFHRNFGSRTDFMVL